MTKEEAINYIIGEEIREGKLNANEIRNGKHSFRELYLLIQKAFEAGRSGVSFGEFLEVNNLP